MVFIQVWERREQELRFLWGTENLLEYHLRYINIVTVLLEILK